MLDNGAPQPIAAPCRALLHEGPRSECAPALSFPTLCCPAACAAPQNPAAYGPWPVLSDQKLPDLAAALQDSATELTLARQLIGNNDQITDVRFLGPPGTPTHLAVATNSEHIRIYSLHNMGCTATLAGHQDTVRAPV